MWSFLEGKKTYLSCLLLSLLGVVWSLDQFSPGEWLTAQQYEAAAAFIGGLTGVSMRWAIEKKE